MRRNATILLATLAGLSITVPAKAKTLRQKVMVLEFPAVQGVAPATLKTLNDYLAGAVRDQGFDVITPSQIGVVLGLEKQRELLGCAESSCLAELGGALGVDFIVIPSAAVLESGMVITLTAVNQRGVAAGSQRKVVAGKTIDGLLPAIDALVPRLMNQARGIATPNLSSAPSEAGGPAGGLSASAEAARPSHTGAYVLLGSGAALVAASVVVGLMAKSSANAYQDGFAGTTQADAQSRTKTLAIASTALTGVGIAAMAAGAGWWIFGGSPQGSTP